MIFFKNKRKKGSAGEDIACDYLKSIGFTITERNFLTRHGEIDIIAEDREHIIFAEVKLRRVDRNLILYGRPARAVTKEKMSNIIYSAKIYLLKNKTQKKPRFDVIEVYEEILDGEKTKYSLKHLPGAFRADDGR